MNNSICIRYKKPYPLYHQSKSESKVILVRVCQDCGCLETCHGPDNVSRWRHIFIHPDFDLKTIQ